MKIQYNSWLEGIYDYAVKVMNPDQVFLGMPAYGWNWRIHDTPKNMGVTYRGNSNTCYAAQLWMTGGYNFTDDKVACGGRTGGPPSGQRGQGGSDRGADPEAGR